MNKADTLSILRRRLKSGIVLPQQTITYKDFKNLNNKKQDISKILKLDNDIKYVVRSSSSDEDTSIASNAGKYESFINVDTSDICDAIARVFASYSSLSLDDIVLIQPYLHSSLRSGVVFSHNPNNGMPYLIDNYVLSNKTNEITSGISHGFKHVCFLCVF